MTRIQTHIWGTSAASSASSGLNVVPPSLLGIALLEMAASGRQRSSTRATWLEEDDDDEEENEEHPHRQFSSVPSANEAEERLSCLVDPVEGQGGTGMVLNPKNKYVCGVCQLLCWDNGMDGGIATSRRRRRNVDRLEAGGRERSQDGEDENDENGRGRESREGGKTLFILFTCNHMYHSACLPEQACVLCLRENFSPF